MKQRDSAQQPDRNTATTKGRSPAPDAARQTALGNSGLQRLLIAKRQQKNAGDTADRPLPETSRHVQAKTRHPAAVPAVSKVRGHLGSGQPLRSGIASKFSDAYGRDLSGVRVHPENPMALRAGAKALTTGRDIVFAPGQYRPGTPRGDDLIGHELAHVVQQSGGNAGHCGGSPDYERQADTAAQAAMAGRRPALSGLDRPLVQRREFGPLEDTTNMGPGDWAYSDRLTNSARFSSANLHNLLAVATHEYTQVEQRRDFYWWFYNLMVARGHDVRWPLAAAVVAGGATEVANRDPAGSGLMRSDTLESLMRRGNQVIFDDVLPKLRNLYMQPQPLTGADALAWDSQVLIEEQNLIQPLYSALTPAQMNTFSDLAKQKGFFATVGSSIFGRVSSGPHNVGGSVPPFPAHLDITLPENRWRYGMMLAHYFAPGSAQDADASLAYAMSLTVPTPSSEYTSGSKLREVDRFSGLHDVTAMITSSVVDLDELRTAIQALTPDQRDVLRRDPTYAAYLRHRHGMMMAEAMAFLSSEDLKGCKLFLVVGVIEGTGNVTEDDGIVVMPTRGLDSGWTTSGGTRRIQVQAVSQNAYNLFTGVPLRWVWKDSLRCYPRPRPTPLPVPPPISVSYTVLYDTGNADLEQDSNAGANFTVLNQLLGQLATFKANPAVERIELSVYGHASPRWRGAKFAGGLVKNYRLSQARAQNTRDYVESAYARYEGPVPIVVIARIVESLFPVAPGPAAADEVSQTGLGSVQGLMETFDANNDQQRFRRADLHLRVTFKQPAASGP